jgi:hypothetical protein
LYRSLTLLQATAFKDLLAVDSSSEVYCGLEAQSNIGTYGDGGLSSKVRAHRFNLPKQVLDKFEKCGLVA